LKKLRADSLPACTRPACAFEGRAAASSTRTLSTGAASRWAFCTLALALLGSAAAWSADLHPFTASYDVSWHGIVAGSSTSTFKKLDDNRWSYSASNVPNGLARMFLPPEITQHSVLRIENGVVQPLSYENSDGTKDGAKNVKVTYDWDKPRVTGMSEQMPVDFVPPAGLQDDLSVQIALINELGNGHTPDSFVLLDNNGTREYKYAREGTETLKTPMGNVETVIYSSQHPGSPRITRFWCAPSYGFVPLKAEQRRKGKVEWTMEVTAMKYQALTTPLAK
jgi:hypothetical protein